MPVTVICPSCEKVFMMKDGLAGRTAKCPSCSNNMILIPTGSESANDWQGPSSADAKKTVGAAGGIAVAIKVLAWYFFLCAGLAVIGGFIGCVTQFNFARGLSASGHFGSGSGGGQALYLYGLFILLLGIFGGVFNAIIGALLFAYAKYFVGKTRLLAHAATSLCLIRQHIEKEPKAALSDPMPR